MQLDVLNRNLSGYNGVAWLVRDDETGDHYVISRADTFDRGDETMIFAANSAGEVLDWADLYAGYSVDHDEAILAFEFSQE